MPVNKVSRVIAYACLEAFVVFFIAILSLNLWKYDMRVPFQYGGDSVIILMYIKGMIQNGWTFNIPQLSAPYAMSAAAFPIMTNFDWSVMRLISLFTSEVGFVLNLFWLLTLVFSAWTASFSMRLLGVGKWLAFAGGILYAFLPFALLRNVAHLNLVYYAVPLLSLLAVHLAGGNNDEEHGMTIRRLGYAGCLIQGFNYVYFSFFAVPLFTVAAAIGYSRSKSRAVVKTAVIAISIVSIATIVNLSPSLLSWYQNGKPPEMSYKFTAEAEHFGAKIRKMIAPHQDNPVPFLAKWGNRDLSAGFPHENENVTARMGLYGALGFLILLAVSMRLVDTGSNKRLHKLQCIAALSLFTLLMITVGGFGATINVLTVQDIRAYNRYSVFVAFFSIAGLGLWIDSKFQKMGSAGWRAALFVGVVCFALLSLYDQLLDRRVLLNGQAQDIENAAHERSFVERLEAVLPSGSKVFQLPLTGFPPLSIHERMVSYDHLRPYLWSNNLYWSWPSFSQRHRTWQDKIAQLEGKDLMRALVLSGFDAVWIDRYGYKDSGVSVIQGLIEAGGQEILPGMSPRYVILDIREPAKQLEFFLGEAKFKDESASTLGVILLNWGSGFYPQERNADGHIFRWSKDRSRLTIFNSGSGFREGRLTFKLASEDTGNVAIHSNGKIQVVPTSTVPVEYMIDFSLSPGAKENIEFVANLGKVNAPNDPRKLYFYVMDFQIHE